MYTESKILYILYLLLCLSKNGKTKRECDKSGTSLAGSLKYHLKLSCKLPTFRFQMSDLFLMARWKWLPNTYYIATELEESHTGASNVCQLPWCPCAIITHLMLTAVLKGRPWDTSFCGNQRRRELQFCPRHTTEICQGSELKQMPCPLAALSTSDLFLTL